MAAKQRKPATMTFEQVRAVHLVLISSRYLLAMAGVQMQAKHGRVGPLGVVRMSVVHESGWRLRASEREC